MDFIVHKLTKKHTGNKLDSAYFMIILGQICQLKFIPNQILMYAWLLNLVQ